MPYFFILPIFAAFLVVMFIALIITRYFAKDMKRASAYIIWGTIGSTLGFIILNVIVNIIGIAPVAMSEKYNVSQNIRDASRFISLITVIIGPFIASVIGVIVGFVCGVYIVYRKRKKLERLTTA